MRDTSRVSGVIPRCSSGGPSEPSLLPFPLGTAFFIPQRGSRESTIAPLSMARMSHLSTVFGTATSAARSGHAWL